MDINITGRRMSVGDELRSFVETRIESATRIFKIDPMTVEVVLRHESKPHHPSPTSAEITLRTKGHIIRTAASDEDIHAAVEIASAKLERQLRKFKSRVMDRRQNVYAPRYTDLVADFSLVNTSEEADAKSDDEQLLRVKEIDLQVLNTDEALLQMDLLGHDFFVYVNAEDGVTAVLYRRHNGGYGMLRPRRESLDG